MNAGSTTLEEVRAVVVSSLGIADHLAGSMTAATPLLGGVSELDSLAVIQLVYALEDRFSIVISDDDVTADAFETLGSLTAVVERQLR